METRIREFRKKRSLTLQGLADRIGTTPQTVQRLETSNMRVSMDWLEKFADVFNVHPADLIQGPASREIPLLGTLGRDAILRPGAAEEGIHLDVPADDPVAIRLETRTGPYEAGTILIGNRLSGADIANAHGTDCLAALENGQIVLRRAIRGANGTTTLVPIRAGADVRYDEPVSWLARIVMTLRYL